jgi:hypothetical protein
MNVRRVVNFVVTAFSGLKLNPDTTLDRRINTYKKQQKTSMCLSSSENLTTRNIPKRFTAIWRVTTKTTTLRATGLGEPMGVQ